MPKFKIASDVFCQRRESPRGKQEVNMTILLEDSVAKNKEDTDFGKSLQLTSSCFAQTKIFKLKQF